MILLDTHVLLWTSYGDRRLGPRARRQLEAEWSAGGVGVSAVSFWEIAMLVQKGRLGFEMAPEDWRRRQLAEGLVEIPVDGDIAMRAGLLADLPGDPADRIIVATALAGHQLMTRDARILAWPGQLDRLDARL